MNLYLTCFDYLRTPTGQETASLVGNTGYLVGTVSAGTMSLPVSALTVALKPYDQIYLFDGSNSEIALVASSTPVGATAVTVAALSFAHSMGTPYCSDGVSGSLAEAILEASGHLERYTEQTLLQMTYTNETLRLRTMESSINSDGTLHFRPRQWPIVAVSGLSLLIQAGTTLTLDPTQCIISSRSMSVDTPVISTTAGGISLLAALPPLTQLDQGWIQVTYTAGYSYSNLPWDIKQAAILLTSNVLSDRQNPVGAAQYRLGQKQIEAYLRGDTTGENALVKRAYSLLNKYKRVS